MSDLVVSGLCKSFFGVPVLKSLDLRIEAGSVLGLVGENGAGKSTLMNLIGGQLRPDAGSMTLGGQPYSPASPREAFAQGVGLVHQELNLFPNLSVAENLFLTNAPGAAGWIRRGEMNRRAEGLLARVGLDVPARMPLANLSAGQQQLVELARVLAADSRVLLLDEPTTSLSVRETEGFFALVRSLSDEGRAVVLITHAIHDVLQHCDRAAVLRDGALVAEGPAGEFDAGSLVQHMVGRPVTQLFPPRRSPPAEARPPLLSVRSVSQPRVVDRVSLELFEGEVLGLFGLMGSGRSELARILAGLDPHAAGSVELAGQTLRGGPRRRAAAGLGLITESRREDGILADSSVADNFTLAATDRFAAGPVGWLQRGGMQREVTSMRQAVSLQGRLNDAQPMKTLSGGNQQKVVIGKWLMTRPKVLVLDEPTRGVDVAARLEIYRLIHAFADRGGGALVISSDLEELLGICDRLLVMSLGRLSGEFGGGGTGLGNVDRAAVMAAALAGHTRRPTTGTQPMLGQEPPR